MSTSLLGILQQIDVDEPFDSKREEEMNRTGKERTRQEKRDKRVKDCGKFANWYNPHTGKRTGHLFRCGLFRYCETCLARRAERECELLKTAALERRIVAKIVTPKQATKLTRRVEKTEYVRFPQEDGNDLLLLDEAIADKVGVEGVEVDLHWVVAQDWTTLVQTPKGRNKSGTIHLPVSEDDPEDFTIISTKQFVTDANRGATTRAMDEAEKETRDLNPRTPDQVVSALYKRIKIATRKLREQGYQTTLYDKRLKLVHGLVDWTGSAIKRIHTENPTNPNLSNRDEFSVERSVVPTQASIPALATQ